MHNPTPGGHRVLVVTHYFPAHGGGIERVAERLVRSYTDQGWDVVWMASATDLPPRPAPHFRPIAVRASNIVERATGLPLPLWGWSGLRQLWTEVARADAIHVHEHIYPGSMVAMLFAALRRRRLVLTQHVGHLPFSSASLSALYRAATLVLARLLMRRAHAVVFISDTVRRFFRNALGASVPGQLAYNGVDSTLFAPLADEDRQTVRKELGVDTSVPVLLFVGRFVAKKGMSLLRELANRTPHLQWVFVGRGPLDPSTWALPNVRVLGQLGQASLARVYGAADLLVLPSEGEGFPLVVQEALACGLPVLIRRETAAACPEALELLNSVAGAEVDDWQQSLAECLHRHAVDGYADRSRRAHSAYLLWSWERAAAVHRRLLLPAA